MSLSLDEFLTRFLLRLLPKSFVRICHFGFLANRRRATLLPLCRQALAAVQPQTQPQASTAKETTPLWLCPNCGGPHGGHREAYGGSHPAPFATLSLRSRCMKQPFPALSLGATHHAQAWCARLAPKPAVCSQPRPKIPFPPHANSHPTNPRLALAGSSSCCPSFSPNHNTIE